VHFAAPLVEGRLISRYKRFLFDAELADGSLITGNCPNTGSMLGLNAPGSRIYISVHDKPARKYAHQLEIVEADATLVGVNTGMPNRIAEEAIRAGLIPSLAPYPILARERRYSANSRIDLLLSGAGLSDAYVEVKNVHFSRTAGLAEFPDTRTDRGVKHLNDLGDAAEVGHCAVMLYVI
jgi:sugar fermentation stimulation protein A